MGKEFKLDKSIVSTLTLIILLFAGFVTTSIVINSIATQSCYNTLEGATAQIGEQIKASVKSDEEQLKVIARILESFDDINSKETQNIICSFEQKNMISSIGILFSDNKMLFCDGKTYNDTGTFDFPTESEQVPYLSGVKTNPSNSEHKYIYQAVPIKKAGVTVGILYGFVNLENYEKLFSVNVFDGLCELYVIDGNTGDFIVDTWHSKLGNTKDENYSSRKSKRGSNFKDIKYDIYNGRSGSIAFLSENAGEYFYAYYKSVGIDKWMVMLSVPESIAFADALRIRYIFYFIAVVNIVVLLIYFLWILTRVKKDNFQKENELTKTKYMFDIQQALFNSYKDSQPIENALEKCGDMLRAENAFLMILDGMKMDDLYRWSENRAYYKFEFKGKSIDEELPYISKCLILDKSVLIYSMDDLKEKSVKDYETLLSTNIRNIILSPVFNSDKKLIGFLGVSNCKEIWNNAQFLECVSINFFMAVNNRNSLQKIKKMGTTDALTGLLNRNSYQKDIEKYSSADVYSLCCIYMDANGLHELNNHLGHAAGDEMLRYIGASLKEVFGERNTYRIGGDEFVAFCRNMDENQVIDKIHKFNDMMDINNYHVSIGFAWKDASLHIDNIISEAEKRMYEDKRLYYEKKGDVSKSREMNYKLEQILLEKKDFESFLSIISSYFLGVYVVDLLTDKTRIIYKPIYFDKTLKQTNYRFTPAIKMYAQSYVHEEDRNRFYEFCNYEKIEQDLIEGNTPKLRYHKIDGTSILMRIYMSSDFNEMKKETFWLFEEEYKNLE